jgi:hypothetical protein
VRILGIIADGPAPQSTRLFIPEAAMLTLSIAGLVLERAGRRNQTASPA